MTRQDTPTSLPASRIELLLGHYSPDETEFIASMLSEEELRVIDGTNGLGVKNYFSLAEVEFMMRETSPDLEVFNKYHIRDLQHYVNMQIPWLQEETALLKENLGRDPTPHEIIEDARQYKNGLRFRAFYCLTFPDKVQAPDN